MIIFSCGRDCLGSIEKHIDSIKNQTFQDFKHIIVDDASCDDALYKKIMSIKGDNCIVYRNMSNFGWLKNAVNYLLPNMLYDDEIIVIVDLDDWMYDKYVLEYINDLYKKDNNLLLTFGSYITLNKKVMPNATDVETTLSSLDFRVSPWVFTHLKTFKAILFKLIKNSSFRDNKGKYLMSTYDRAIMYPMVEMAGVERIKYIDKILYVYNTSNPNNVYKINSKMQSDNKKYISSLERYEKIDDNLL